MSDLEAVMWVVEQDPYLSSTFGSVTLLDRMPDVDRLRRRLGRMAANIPRLHQRVVPGSVRLAAPLWQPDPDFDLAYHVRRVALPAPGDRAALLELARAFVQDPLDRRRPLWQYLMVEGFEGGRAALVQKMHHAITDGVGGVRMSEQFVDLTREAPDIDVPAIDVTDGATTRPPAPVAERDGVLGAVTHTARRGAGLARDLAGTVLADVRHPSRAAALPGAAVAAARSTARQLLVTDAARSPLWTQRSLQRVFTAFDVDFDDAHRTAKALGGSLNDFFVTAAAGGAGAYHRHQGSEVDVLRMAMPVSTRKDRSAAGNAFVPTRLLVPAGTEDPVARFAAVHDALGAARREPAIGLAGAFAGLAVFLPAPVLTGAARRQVETVDFTTSNVRAAPFDLFVAGARIDATYAIGPLAGTAFNLTMMSYCGALNLGLHVDRRAVADPALLRRCLADSFADLLAAGH